MAPMLGPGHSLAGAIKGPGFNPQQRPLLQKEKKYPRPERTLPSGGTPAERKPEFQGPQGHHRPLYKLQG